MPIGIRLRYWWYLILNRLGRGDIPYDAIPRPPYDCPAVCQWPGE